MKYRKYIFLVAVLISFHQGVVNAQQSKLPSTQRFNPIVPDWIADPSVVKFGDTFYLYATTDIDKGLDRMGPPVVWKSTDFVNWHFEGILETGIDWQKPHAFKDDKGIKKTGYFRYWAPGKTIKKNNQYYLFPTIVKPDGKTGTYVMIGENPTGPFRFTNGTGICFNEPGKVATETKPLLDDIDGEPFVDNDGNAFVYWRRRLASAVSADLLSLKGTVVNIPTKFGGYSEGPGLFRRKNTYYYFYTLSGHASYHNGYMMSTESPLSGFKNPAGKNIFIFSDTAKSVWGPGHGNVFKMPGKDDYYFLYLEYGEGSTTRQVFANKMEFNADGTLRPVTVSAEGVGYLAKPNNGGRKNLALGAMVTASGYKEPRSIAADITPDPDLAEVTKNLPVVKAKRVFSYGPGNAADASNGTRWQSEPGDTDPWILFDLGKAQKINRIEMYFTAPTFGHTWQMDKSMDGKTWVTSAAQKETAIRSPHIATAIGKAQYIRIKITSGDAGMWECKIF